ncbi:hypothetical protein QBC47DRAFT_382593 [Echria macrotheca]|uniref:Uncharacterized protein n=1 Tax=Echria macrotheca TaxID=438768 RepID=A0AAJ0BB53_9PEZI|nr:hypothetical protein QBC47DRAFT_382593 [Echria macrotheca]
MHRQAVQTALGRGSLATESPRLASSLAARCQRGRRQPFSTSTAVRSNDDNNGDGNKPSSSRERSQAAASAISKLTGKPRSPPRAASGVVRKTPSGGIDARALGDMIRSIPVDATKVVSLRNLRGPIGGMRAAPTTKRGLDPQPIRSRFPQRIGGGPPGAGPTGGARPPMRARTGGGGGPGGRRGPKRRGGGEKKDGAEGRGSKMQWSAEEKSILDRLDQGEVVEYRPRVTLKDLSGYGAAAATDAPLGKVESVIRAMRILGGGAAFNSDLSPTADYHGLHTRYVHEKKPIFFNSAEEKGWVRWAWKTGRRYDHTMKYARAGLRNAIVDAVVKGKYEMTTSFVDTRDAMGAITSYQSQTFSYKPSDSKAFLKKVEALLPANARP